MRINLLPPEYRPKQAITFLNLLILLGCVFICISSIGFGVFEYLSSQDSTRKLATVEQQIGFLQSQLAEVQKLELTQMELGKLQREIEQIKGFYQPQLAIFNSLAVPMPGNLWLEEVVIDPDGEVTVSGQALTVTLIGNYLNSINDSRFYQTTALKEIKLEEDNGLASYQFDLELATGRGSLEYNEKK